MAMRKGGEKMIDLKTKREEAGLTQSQLAEKVGVIRQTISNIECGISAPSVPTAIAIGKVLGIDWKGFFEE